MGVPLPLLTPKMSGAYGVRFPIPLQSGTSDKFDEQSKLSEATVQALALIPGNFSANARDLSIDFLKASHGSSRNGFEWLQRLSVEERKVFTASQNFLVSKPRPGPWLKTALIVRQTCQKSLTDFHTHTRLHKATNTKTLTRREREAVTAAIKAVGRCCNSWPPPPIRPHGTPQPSPTQPLVALTPRQPRHHHDSRANYPPSRRMDTSQSNSAYTINDSSVGDDDSLFRKVPGDKYPDNKPRAVCKKCSIEYVAVRNSGIGNLRRHYETCAKFKKRDLVQMMLDRSDGLSTRLPKFEAHVFCDLLSCAIIIHDLPFQFVEYEGIRRIWNYLCDEVPNICRNTAKADVLKMHNREKTKIRSMLEEAHSRICLTTDLWTSITADGYLCLTAHFIDKGWNLQKKVLNFFEMPTPHTGVALAEKILSLLCEWGIEKRIFSLTVDNASSNDVCVVMLKSQLRLRNALVCDGDFFHIRCCAHIINLIVQQGLKEIEKEIEKARESVKYVKGSQVRKIKFLECVKQVSLDDKKGLRQDVPTRWNSTFLMLDSVLYYKNAFCHLQLSDYNYKNCPSEEEWGKIEKIGKFLSMFYEITCIFSGSKYPTSNLYFPKVFVTKVALDQLLCSEDVYMKTMAQKMIEKFEKYWYDFCTILAIAVILDPRYKIAFIEFAYNKAYGQNSEELKHV
ncbi:hypothetical protein WN944_018650 [Citrus x changshan-huyou]|uniref:hAT-like transposase RNase-H fold domain-containing protein n=1 Tax=Citrus x changshan-huyou TaxID=2935761 RepID=A0AAP0LUI1_9ROSI